MSWEPKKLQNFDIIGQVGTSWDNLGRVGMSWEPEKLQNFDIKKNLSGKKERKKEERR